MEEENSPNMYGKIYVRSRVVGCDFSQSTGMPLWCRTCSHRHGTADCSEYRRLGNRQFDIKDLNGIKIWTRTNKYKPVFADKYRKMCWVTAAETIFEDPVYDDGMLPAYIRERRQM